MLHHPTQTKANVLFLTKGFPHLEEEEDHMDSHGREDANIQPIEKRNGSGNLDQGPGAELVSAK